MFDDFNLTDRTFYEIIIGLVGIYLTIYGLSISALMMKLLRSGIRTEGEVVEIKRKAKGGRTWRRTYNYYPVIIYQTFTGPIKQDYDIVKTDPCLYQLWETVPVIYDKNDPNKFVIDNFSSKLAGPASFILGVGLIIGAASFYILDPLNAL